MLVTFEVTLFSESDFSVGLVMWDIFISIPLTLSEHRDVCSVRAARVSRVQVSKWFQLSAKSHEFLLLPLI